MRKLAKGLFLLGAVGTLAGSIGFMAFADAVRSQSASTIASADAIVVLTGDEERIATGLRLMVEGRARRLLVSGVHPATRMPTELKRRIHGNDRTRESLVKCCVDIGYDALNTSGNAEEARQWVEAHGFRSLIVVTSGYHMPRGLLEFRRVMPDVALKPYPVMASRNLRLEAWWQHWPTARLLAGEYAKLIGAFARYGWSRVLASLAGAATAAGSAQREHSGGPAQAAGR